MIVPTTTVSLLTERALSAALSLGDTVVAVAVAGDEEECEQIKQRLGRLDAAASRSRCCSTPTARSCARVLRYVESIEDDGRDDHRADPRDHPAQAPPRDPPQPARPAARGGAQGAHGRRRRDAAVSPPRLMAPRRSRVASRPPGRARRRTPPGRANGTSCCSNVAPRASITAPSRPSTASSTSARVLSRCSDG